MDNADIFCLLYHPKKKKKKTLPTCEENKKIKANKNRNTYLITDTTNKLEEQTFALCPLLK